MTWPKIAKLRTRISSSVGTPPIATARRRLAIETEPPISRKMTSKAEDGCICSRTRKRDHRFASGLSVLDFMKRTSFIELDEGALQQIGPAAVALAEAEGLPAHARSVAVRLGQ